MFPFILLLQRHQTKLPWCSEESSIPCFVPCNQQLRINIGGNKRFKSLCPSMVSCYILSQLYPNVRLLYSLLCTTSWSRVYKYATTHSILHQLLVPSNVTSMQLSWALLTVFLQKDDSSLLSSYVFFAAPNVYTLLTKCSCKTLKESYVDLATNVRDAFTL
jgi:hypothetical protein